MNKHKDTKEQQSLTHEQVSDYLQNTPGFYNQYPELLETLQVTETGGGVVSLTLRQLKLLREKNLKLQSQLDNLLEIARANDALFGNMQRLTTDLMEARCVEDIFATLDDTLREYFNADFFTLRIVDEGRSEFPISEVLWNKESPELEPFVRLFESGKIKCGHPTHAQAVALFKDKADDVQSTALIPIKVAGQNGLLAIGSRDTERFHPTMGVLFLSNLGELVAKRLASLQPV